MDAPLPKIRLSVKHKGDTKELVAQVIAAGITTVANRNPTVNRAEMGTRPDETGEVTEEVCAFNRLRECVNVFLLVLNFHCCKQCRQPENAVLVRAEIAGKLRSWTSAP